MPANDDRAVDPQEELGDDAYSACATQGQDVILMAGQARADAYNFMGEYIRARHWFRRLVKEATTTR